MSSASRLAFRLFRWSAVLVVAAAALFVAGKYWIAPAVIRWQVAAALNDYWDGTVRIDEVDFSLTGPTRLGGIEIRDSAGRVWARIGSLTARLRDWPGVKPVLTDVEIDGLALRAHFTDGRFAPPLRTPPPGPPSERVDIRSVRVTDISLSVADGNRESPLLGPCRFDVERKDGDYSFSLLDSPPGGPATPLMTGELRADGNAVLRVRVRRNVLPEEAGAVLAAARVPLIVRAEGEVDADVTLTQSGGDPNALQARGTVSLARGRCWGAGGVVAEDVAATLRLEGRTARLANLSARACKGCLTGSGVASLGPGLAPGDFRGQAAVEKIDMPELLRALAAGADMKEGQLSGNFVFQVSRASPVALVARGQARIEKADLVGIPLIKAIVEYVGVGQIGRFHAEGAFGLRDWVLTVEQARMADPFSAFDVQPGGTLDLKAELIDVHVVAAAFSNIKGVLDKVSIPLLTPLAGLTGDLLQHLTRIRIQGRWSDPPEKLIRKDIGQDLQEGTLKFLNDAVKGGGQFGQETFKTFDELLKSLNGKNGKKNGASAPAPK